MMRDGRLLAEAPPAELLVQYGKETLEDVFLQLCHASLSDLVPERLCVNLPRFMHIFCCLL